MNLRLWFPCAVLLVGITHAGLANNSPGSAGYTAQKVPDSDMRQYEGARERPQDRAYACPLPEETPEVVYTVVSDIPYIDPADTSIYRKERCRLDICCPDGRKGCKTIVWFHGGGLEGGNKELLPELKHSGVIIVAPNYRLYPQCRAPGYVDDAAAAVAWVVQNIARYGGDPSQVYVGGHSAGGYLALMLALDASYLAKYGIDADSIKGYFPVSGQTATHYTIRKERGISVTLPLVDHLAPLNHVRVLGTDLVLITGDRHLELMARYEENLYLKSVLESIGNASVPLYELNGFDHGTVLAPAALLIRNILVRAKGGTR